jgi:20S proteasome alpha/beta subunit
MTIIVGIASPDGIVLASDSRITSTVGEAHRIRSDSAQKVFAIEERFGVATSGLAFIADDTIAGVMDRFLAQLDEEKAGDIDAFADALGTFFDGSFTEWVDSMGETWDVEQSGHALHFLVSGYDEEGVGHIMK